MTVRVLPAPVAMTMSARSCRPERFGDLADRALLVIALDDIAVDRFAQE